MLNHCTCYMDGNCAHKLYRFCCGNFLQKISRTLSHSLSLSHPMHLHTFTSPKRFTINTHLLPSHTLLSLFLSLSLSLSCTLRCLSVHISLSLIFSHLGTKNYNTNSYYLHTTHNRLHLHKRTAVTYTCSFPPILDHTNSLSPSFSHHIALSLSLSLWSILPVWPDG